MNIFPHDFFDRRTRGWREGGVGREEEGGGRGEGKGGAGGGRGEGEGGGKGGPKHGLRKFTVQRTGHSASQV